MATFDWTSLNDGDVLSPFDPDADVLNFDDGGISASAILVDTSGSDLILSFGGKTVTVQIDPRSATSTNVTFSDGSALLIGDDTSGTASDNAANILIGGNTNDQLIGLGGADTLDAGDGDDLVNGGLGNDNLDGGTGVDFADYRAASGSVTVNLTTEVSSGAEGADELANFEGILGSGFSDTLTGSNLADNALYGMDGNDLLRQTAGADTLDGGEGTDRIDFSQVTGVVYGAGVGVTVDMAAGTSDADNSSGANAVATLVSIETVVGTVGDDSFFGGDVTHAPDVLGNGVTETFQPRGGNDAVTGATGNGVTTRVDYAAFASAMTIDLGAGTATGTEIGTDSLVRVDQVFAGSGDDSLSGGSQERAGSGGFFELFRGNAGNDTIDGAGTDTVVGTAGSDAAYYANSTSAVIANLGAAPIVVGLDTVLGGTARDGFGFIDTLLNIDQIEGSVSNDTLVGGAGNHRLIGGAGNDSLVGAVAGVEASYQTALSAVSASLASGIASDGLGGTDALVNIDALRGSDFDDTLTGDGGGNRIAGEAGDDAIDGGGGIDFASYNSMPLALGGINAFIESGAGTVADGFGTTDTLTNIEGLTGTHSDDALTGGLGDQWFIGRGGSDSIDGGDGTDWVSYINDPAGVTVDLGTGTASDGWGGVWALGGTDTLVNIENIEGSDFADTLTGDGGDNILRGGRGNDSLDGGAGAMDIADYAEATAGVTVSLATNTSAGADGVDALGNFEGISGSEFADTLTGKNGVANALYGLGGDDLLRQTTGADTLDGGEGTDRIDFTQTGVIYGGAVGVAVNLATGISDLDSSAAGDNSTLIGIEAVTGTAGNDSFVGGAGTDAIHGGDGDDLIDGQAGNDTLNGGTGADTLIGGLGGDTYVADNALDVVTEAAVVGTDLIQSSVSIALLAANVEKLTLTGALAINGAGNTLANTITGNGAANVLNGGTGADTLVGGLGGDTYVVDNAGDVVTEAGAGIDLIQSSVSIALLAVNVEKLTLTGALAINGTGNTLANTITGNGAANVLNGGAGADSVNGGLGNDTYVIDASDVLTDSGGIDTVQAGFSYSLLAGFEKLTLTGGLAINGTGNTLANTITGNGVANVLNGRAGADRLNGGLGNDTYVIDASDVLIDSGGIDMVKAGFSYSLLAGFEKLTLTGGLAINGTGNPLANTITGNGAANVLSSATGHDTLIGLGGNDVLHGGTGRDTLTGSAGLDKYDFNTALNASTNVDTITAYSLADDLIRLDNDFFMGLATGALAGSKYYEAAGATQGNDASDRIVYNMNNGRLYFDADGSGNGDSVLFAILSGAPNIGAADFLIVN